MDLEIAIKKLDLDGQLEMKGEFVYMKNIT